MGSATLLTTTLRRCRYRVGPIDFLRDPKAHTDYLVDFVVKRVELGRLPGAPVPSWQAASNRGDVFRGHRPKTLGRDLLPGGVTSNTVAADEQDHRTTSPAKAKTPRPFMHKRRPLTEESLIDAMAALVFEEVTLRFDFTREVCELVRDQVLTGNLDQYRVEGLAATSFNGVVKELHPAEFPDYAPDLISTDAGWLAGILLALRQRPGWIYGATEKIGARAIQIQQARYDGWVADRIDRSQHESLGA